MGDLDLIVAGGIAVTPWGVSRIDIGVADGTIRELAESPSELSARRTIDADGMYVFPGAVDPHVHFENPSMGTETAHDFGLGSEAAALGGTTTFIDFAFQRPNETPLDALRQRRAIADRQAVVDYGLHGCITRGDEESFRDIPALVAEGYPSIKVFMVYRQEGWMIEDGDLLAMMRAMAPLGATLLVHAENEMLLQWGIARRVIEGDLVPRAHARSRPPIVEAEAIRRTAYFSLVTNCPLFVVHMSTADGAKEVQDAKTAGANVHAETCVHYLVLDETYLDRRDGFRYVVSPPLRSKENQAALWAGLANGTIESIGSDDAAYFEQYKLRGKDDFRHIANGLPGVQIRVPLLFSEGVLQGRISIERFVDAVATRPAQLFGLYPRKGILAPGSDADIVVFDPALRWRPTVANMHTNIEYTCYEEFQVTGRPVHVFSRGRPVVLDGMLVGKRGSGTFIKRLPGKANAYQVGEGSLAASKI